MLELIQFASLVASIVASYFIWIRPVLKSRANFATYRGQVDNCWQAAKLRFAGIKAKLVAGFGMAASIVVLLYDSLLPTILQVDWTPITQKVPGWVWPLALFATYWLIGKFRQYTDERAKAGL